MIEILCSVLDLKKKTLKALALTIGVSGVVETSFDRAGTLVSFKEFGLIGSVHPARTHKYNHETLRVEFF